MDDSVGSITEYLRYYTDSSLVYRYTMADDDDDIVLDPSPINIDYQINVAPSVVVNRALHIYEEPFDLWSYEGWNSSNDYSHIEPMSISDIDTNDMNFDFLEHSPKKENEKESLIDPQVDCNMNEYVQVEETKKTIMRKTKNNFFMNKHLTNIHDNEDENTRIYDLGSKGFRKNLEIEMNLRDKSRNGKLVQDVVDRVLRGKMNVNEAAMAKGVSVDIIRNQIKKVKNEAKKDEERIRKMVKKAQDKLKKEKEKERLEKEEEDRYIEENRRELNRLRNRQPYLRDEEVITGGLDEETRTKLIKEALGPLYNNWTIRKAVPETITTLDNALRQGIRPNNSHIPKSETYLDIDHDVLPYYEQIIQILKSDPKNVHYISTKSNLYHPNYPSYILLPNGNHRQYMNRSRLRSINSANHMVNDIS